MCPTYRAGSHRHQGGGYPGLRAARPTPSRCRLPSSSTIPAGCLEQTTADARDGRSCIRSRCPHWPNPGCVPLLLPGCGWSSAPGGPLYRILPRRDRDRAAVAFRSIPQPDSGQGSESAPGARRESGAGNLCYQTPIPLRESAAPRRGAPLTLAGRSRIQETIPGRGSRERRETTGPGGRERQSGTAPSSAGDAGCRY